MDYYCKYYFASIREKPNQNMDFSVLHRSEVSCDICDVQTQHRYQLRIRLYDEKNKVFIYEERDTWYCYVCEECFKVASEQMLPTIYGGYALPRVTFNRLRYERALFDVKQPEE